MKVLVLTEGGRKKGFGHLTRCIALAQALKERMDVLQEEVEISLIIKGDNSIGSVFGAQGFEVTITDWVENYMDLHAYLTGADLVIIDSYSPSEKIYEFIHKILFPIPTDTFNHRLVCIDDYNRINYPPGIVINPSIFGRLLDYPLSQPAPKPLYLLGSDYIILRKEFQNLPSRAIRKTAKDILITSGIARHADFLKALLRFLATKAPNLKYHINMSKSDLEIDCANINISFHPYCNPLDMCNLLLGCDMAISAGGQTTYELARVGTPAAGICFAENQELNLSTLQKEGLIEYVGWYNDSLLFAKLSKVMDTLASQNKRTEFQKKAQKFVDGKGVKRIADRLIEFYESNK